MRLCGISSRFQLLSPSTRQVTHALLTRPPLTFQSLGFMKSPFDLHVLGTPPAFILSQDQTLMLKWCLCPASFIWHCLLLIRVACQSFDQLACSWISLKILEFSGLHYCLFVKDHNLLLRKSSFIRCCCSQRQLWYLIITAFVCQQLFSIFSNLFLNRKTFIFAVEFHTPPLLRALSTTFYIYFSKHLHNGGNGVKKEISIS